MKILVLGAGLVGRPMALDLAKDQEFEISVADIDKAALERVKKMDNTITALHEDLSNPERVSAIARDFDIVLSAVPGFLGFQTLRALIESKVNIVDIAFCPENAMDLDVLAKEHGVTAIVDCGVAPGMNNVLTGYAHHQLDTTELALTYVGGLPVERKWPYEYKAVFSPIDVIEEYTRPARYVENGALVTRPALTDSEYLDFPGVGTLEAFNSDGLRSMADTIDCPNMKEKTLRYIGHIDKMKVLRDGGFFDTEPVEIKGQRIRPIDLTCKLLFRSWKLEEGEADLTVMKVIIEGIRDGERKRFTYDLLDHYDSETKTHSMARTTGYTATAAVRLLANKLYNEPGVCPPEFLGKHEECVRFMLDELAKRNVIYRANIEDI
ncbi:MAG: saccharopine dehydrogenase C-terminal domain-containing protein [Myxococcota bacterium]|nr:saccharopine dehydrogenase C-terminal domain-containing protein [Myxococcota bacterium]